MLQSKLKMEIWQPSLLLLYSQLLDLSLCAKDQQDTEWESSVVHVNMAHVTSFPIPFPSSSTIC